MVKIFNPLKEIKPTVKKVEKTKIILQATSSLYNEEVGICPKCKVKMTTSKVEGIDVFFCSKDRVVLPLPNKEC